MCRIMYHISALLQTPAAAACFSENATLQPCESWEQSVHLQLEPWSSGPASGRGFKDLFDHGDAFQNTYLLLGL